MANGFPKLDDGAKPKPKIVFGGSNLLSAFLMQKAKTEKPVGFDIETQPLFVGFDYANAELNACALFGAAYGMGKAYTLGEIMKDQYEKIVLDGLGLHVGEVMQLKWPTYLDDLVSTKLRPEKPWEAKLPHERDPDHQPGFRAERKAADPRRRRRAKAARKQRRRCR